MGMNSPELLLLVENCPKGAETLVTRCLHSLTDKGASRDPILLPFLLSRPSPFAFSGPGDQSRWVPRRLALL